MTETRENLINPLEDGLHSLSEADLLSEVLAQIRLSGDQVQSTRIGANGSLALDTDAAYALIVTEGALRLTSPADEGYFTLDRGDLALLPRGPGDLRIIAPQESTAIVCRFRFDAYSLRGMLAALPARLTISHADAAEWLDGLVHFLMIETVDTQPGAALMISRIIDILVIRALRTWIHLQTPSGWLGGLADARIARALKAIHQQPVRIWRVEALADLAGMSRSGFAERFAQLVGLSPLRYQNEWRLVLARDLLARPGARIGEVGLSIGYESEAAFSRAYKALFGHSPRHHGDN